MRTWQTLSVVALTLLVPSMHAAPSIIIDSDPPNPTVIVNNFFSFTANSLGGGDFSFVNGTNERWIRLDVFISLPQLGPITCGPGPFITCTPTPLAPASSTPLPYDIVFGPAANNGGLAPNTNFSINLNDNGSNNTDPSGSGSWGPNAVFNVQITGVTVTPEPAAWALTGVGLLAGLTAFWRCRSFEFGKS